MPWDDQGVFLTLAINVAGAALILTILLLLHRRPFFRCVYHPRHRDDTGQADLYRLRSPLSLYKFLGVPEWLERCGGDYAVLLQLQVMITEALTVYGLLALLLIPVNITDDYRYQVALEENVTYTPGIEDLTMVNVSPGSWRLWLHALASFILSVLIWRLMYKALALLYSFKNHIAPDPVHWSTAQIAGAQCNSPQQVLCLHFPPNQPPSAVFIISIPLRHLSAYDDLTQRRRDLIEKLRHACAFEVTRKEPLRVRLRVWQLCGPKQEAVDLWLAEISSLDDQMATLACKYRAGRPCGPVFLTFPSIQDHLAFRRWHAFTPKSSGVVSTAPLPHDILWENLHRGRWFQAAARLVVLFLFCVLLLFWSIPVSFLSSLDQIARIPLVGPGLKDVLTLSPWLSGFVQAYLPAIVLALFNLLLPYICGALAGLAAPHTRGALHALTLAECYTFVFCVLLLTSIFGAGIQGLVLLFGTLSPQNLLDLLVRIVSPKVGFFFARVISAAFIEMWLPTLQLVALFMALVRRPGTIGRRERRAAYAVEAVEVWQQYVDPLLTLSIAVVFGVTIPFIPIFGALYFYFKVVRDQYTFTHVNPKRPASQLRLLPLVLHFILLALDVHQWGMLGLLAVKTQWVCFGVYLPIPFLTLVVHWLISVTTPVLFLRLEEVASGQPWMPPPNSVLEWVVLAMEYSIGVLPAHPRTLPPVSSTPPETCPELQSTSACAVESLPPLRVFDRRTVPEVPEPLTAEAYLNPLEAYQPPEPPDMAAIRSEVEVDLLRDCLQRPSVDSHCI